MVRFGTHDAVDYVVDRPVAAGDQQAPPASLQGAVRDVLTVVGGRRVLDLERNPRSAQRALDSGPGMSAGPPGQRVDDREPGGVRHRTGGVQYSSTNCCCARTAPWTVSVDPSSIWLSLVRASVQVGPFDTRS